MYMVFYCIGGVVVNGWFLYCRYLIQKNVLRKNYMFLLMFQIEIVVGFCKVGKLLVFVVRLYGRLFLIFFVFVVILLRKRKVILILNLIRDVQFDQCGYFLVFQEKQQRCRYCKIGYLYLKCCKCEVYFCLVKCRNCFNVFYGVNQLIVVYCWLDFVGRYQY